MKCLYCDKGISTKSFLEAIARATDDGFIDFKEATVDLGVTTETTTRRHYEKCLGINSTLSLENGTVVVKYKDGTSQEVNA